MELVPRTYGSAIWLVKARYYGGEKFLALYYREYCNGNGTQLSIN